MHYLIDGHNLIGQMPNIALDDPDDEEQLIVLLHRWTLRHPRDRITVVFDGGSYGHPPRRNPERVEVIFARSPSDADTRLIRRLETLPRAHGYTLVSSDQVVANAARARAIAVKRSDEFAVELAAPPDGAHASHVARQRQRPEPKLARAEVDRWLRVFGAEKE